MTAPRIDTLGTLLNDSFRLWWRGLRWTAPLALLGALPSLRSTFVLPTLSQLQADPEGASLALIDPLLRGETWGWWGVTALLWLWLAGGQTLLLDRLQRAELPRPLHALGIASLRLPLILLSTLLCLLLCALPLLPMLAFNAWLGLQDLPMLAMLGLSVLSSLLIVLPIGWIAVSLAFLPYAAVLEGEPPWQSLARSRRLVAGQWWRLLVFLSIPLTLYGIAALMAMATTPLLQLVLSPPSATALGDIAGLGVAALGGPLLHACLVCAYRERGLVAGAARPRTAMGPPLQ